MRSLRAVTEMARLTGIGVLVTRPEHQAHHLCHLIAAEGGAPVRYPALVIKPRSDRAAVRAAIGPADRYDLIIFISANSVRFGADFLDQKRDVRIAAVGQPTAAALNAAGYRVSIMPAEGAGSDELLSMPEMAQISGQRVLIMRGSGGRELLAEVLTARGAQVQYAEVYTREPARPGAELQGEIETLWRQGGIRAYAATSVELLEALVGIVTPRCRELMDSTALVTGSRRVAESTSRLGLGSPVLLADSPDDAALTGALIRWRIANAQPV
jgi:uroporphyrinogen-III synthase